MLHDTTTPAAWYLEGISEDGREILKTMVMKLPFRVGRRLDSELVLQVGRVSLKHAMLYLRQKNLWLRDLGSTNGTFVNGRRIDGDQMLRDGDVIHFADQEFRLVASAPQTLALATQTMSLSGFDFQSQLFDRQRRLREMLRDDSFVITFQPVVLFADRSVTGYELLGRGRDGSGELTPGELFQVAESIGLEKELSAALRSAGLAQSAGLPKGSAVFFNTHPSELKESGALLASLEQLRARHPERRLVLEIHEAAVADQKVLKDLRTGLDALRIELAFDDFGTGQTRLLELIAAAPHYVKFDRSWIHDLHRATAKRRELVATLVGLVAEMEVSSIAAGIETAEEAEACRELGFVHAQGYFFGRPAAASAFS